MDEIIVNDFLEYSRFSEARLNLDNYSEELKKALKANIAQQLYGPNAFEYILNEGDPMLQKVLELEAPIVED